jgi:predicted PurR-regulated permease PerM
MHLKKQPNIFLLLSALLLVLVVLFVVFIKSEPKPEVGITPLIKNMPGIEVSLPKTNAVIESPLKITGTVNGNGWAGFEGQVGTVTLLDNNGKELAKSALTATTEWTKLPTQFQVTITFISPGTGNGTLVFHNENASGDAAKDATFTVPITFK